MAGETTRLLSQPGSPPARYDTVPAAEPAADVEQQQQQVQAEEKKSYWGVIGPMAAAVFLVAMDGTVVVSSYAAIGNELKELKNASWIATAYLLAVTCFQPLFGKLSDIFGRKGCIVFCYTVFALGCLLCGFSRTLPQLIAARAISGVGGGGLQTLVTIVVSDVVPLRSRGTWQGVLNMIFAVGTATGASLGGYFADTIGWRWSFWVQVPVALIGLVAVIISLDLPQIAPENLREKLKRVDFAGATTLLLTVSFLLVGLDRGGDIGWKDEIARYSMLGFALFGALLVYIEFGWAQHPFAPKGVIVNRSMIASYLVNLFGIGAQFQVLFHVPLYLQAVQARTASQASLPLIFGVVCTMAGSVGSGLIMQSTGRYYWLSVTSFGLLLLGVTVISLGCGIVVSSMVVVTCGLMFSSLGIGVGLTTSLISLIANAGPQDQAVATAVSYLFRSMGSVVGLSTASMITQVALKHTLRERLAGGQDVDEIVRRVRESLEYLNELDEVTRAIVRGSYETAIQTALYFAISIGALALISSIFIKEAPLPPRK